MESLALVENLSVAALTNGCATLRALGVDVSIRAPYGIPTTTPFPQDVDHATTTQAQWSASGGSSAGPTACSGPTRVVLRQDEPRASLALPDLGHALRRRASPDAQASAPSTGSVLLANVVSLAAGRPDRQADVLRLPGARLRRRGARPDEGPGGSNEPASLPSAVRAVRATADQGGRPAFLESLPGGCGPEDGIGASSHRWWRVSADRAPRPGGRLIVGRWTAARWRVSLALRSRATAEAPRARAAAPEPDRRALRLHLTIGTGGQCRSCEAIVMKVLVVVRDATLCRPARDRR